MHSFQFTRGHKGGDSLGDTVKRQSSGPCEKLGRLYYLGRGYIILLKLEGKEVPALSNSEFIGQGALRERIDSILLLHGGADWLPGHMLFQGENGSGRRSMARALAAALRVEFVTVDASIFQQAGDLTALLTTNLPQRSLLCVYNLEALKPALQDRFASALRTGSIDVTIGSGTGWLQ